MINATIDGISQKIYETFGDKYTIHKENVEQGLNEPCFLILHLESTNDAKLPNRYLRRNHFDVHFFPKKSTEMKNEMYSVAEKLFIGLEYIFVLDNLCKGTKMRFEIVDDVLHFFVNYDTFIKAETTKADSMDEIKYNSTLET